jgi:protein-disulfide isomerase
MKTESMKTFKKSALMAFSAPLALALAACGGGESTDGPLPVSEPIASIAPPEGQLWQDVASDTEQGGVVVGNPDAPLKLVEFASHTCSHCADFSQQASAALLNQYVASGVVSYEIRNLIRDPIDLSIAVLARCNGPVAFHPLAEQAWENYTPIIEQAQANLTVINAAAASDTPDRNVTIADAAGLLDFFASRGISRDAATACLSDLDKIEALASLSDEIADDYRVDSTPTLFLNNADVGTRTWPRGNPLGDGREFAQIHAFGRNGRCDLRRYRPAPAARFCRGRASRCRRQWRRA